MTKNRILSTIMVCLCCLTHYASKAGMHTGFSSAPLLNDPIEYCDSTAYCFQQSQCDDTNCQNAIVLCHQICEAAFNSMTAAVATPSVYLGSYSVGMIRSMLSTLDCKKGHYISFTEAGGALNLSPAGTGFIPSSGSGRYSIAFFEGVLRAHMPDNTDVFRFYKVKDGNGTESIGLKLTKGNTDVFFSDVSGMYP